MATTQIANGYGTRPSAEQRRAWTAHAGSARSVKGPMRSVEEVVASRFWPGVAKLPCERKVSNPLRFSHGIEHVPSIVRQKSLRRRLVLEPMPHVEQRVNNLARQIEIIERVVAENMNVDARPQRPHRALVSAPVATPSRDKADSALDNVMRSFRALETTFFAPSSCFDRDKCASKLSALFRGIMTRARFEKAKRSIVALTAEVSRDTVEAMRSDLAKQAKVDAAIATKLSCRNTALSEHVFEKWKYEARRLARQMAESRLEADKIRRRTDHCFVRSVFLVLRNTALGPRSRKACRSRYEKRQEEARQVCAAQYAKQGMTNVIILPEDVRAEVLRTMHKETASRCRRWCLRHHFRMLSEAITKAKVRERDAGAWSKRKMCAKCFYPWTEYVFEASTRLDRERWPAPRCYKPRRYNQRLVDRFARRRMRRELIAPAFAAFKCVYRTAHAGRLVITRRSRTYAATTLTVWLAELRRRANLRRDAVTKWRAKCRLILARPLYAWYVYMREVRTQRADRERLIRAKIASRQRHQCISILRRWRHQAKYGRLDGMYTRADLIRSLREMRAHAKRIESRAEATASQCTEMSRVIDEQRNNIAALDAKIAEFEDRETTLRFAVQKGEGELATLASLIERIAVLRPRIVRAVLLDAARHQTTQSNESIAADCAKPIKRFPFPQDSPLHRLMEASENDLDVIYGPRADSLTTAPHAIADEKKAAAESMPSQYGTRDEVSFERALELYGGHCPANLSDSAANVIRRAKWVLTQPASNFRNITHLGGVALYRSTDDVSDDLEEADDESSGRKSRNSQGDLQDHPWKRDTPEEQAELQQRIEGDLKLPFALFNFLVTGDLLHLDENLRSQYKMALDSGLLDKPWDVETNRPLTVRGNEVLPTWGEFRRAIEHPGRHKA